MAVQHPGHAPDLRKFLKSLKGSPLQTSINQLVSLLKRCQITGPEPCAIATAYILRQVVAHSKWTDVDALLANVRRAGQALAAAQPHELAIANVTRRVLGTIRNEATEDRADDAGATSSVAVTARNSPQTSASLQIGGEPTPLSLTLSQSATKLGATGGIPRTLLHLLAASPQPLEMAAFATSGTSSPGAGVFEGTGVDPMRIQKLKLEIIECIQELQDEIESADEMIAGILDVPLHYGDSVLLFRPSRTVERFMLRVASKKRLTIYIASAPLTPNSTPGPSPFKAKLAASGVPVVSLQSSNIMAYMPRITKIVLGARSVAVNGGFLAGTGAGAVVRAAVAMRKPVFVLAAVFKLSPLVPSARHDRAETVGGCIRGPSAVNFADGAIVERVRVRNPQTEWIDGESVDVYVTSLGAHSRDQLRDIISETYGEEDLHVEFGTEGLEAKLEI